MCISPVSGRNTNQQGDELSSGGPGDVDERAIVRGVLTGALTLAAVRDFAARDFVDRQLGVVFASATALLEHGGMPTLERLVAMERLDPSDTYCGPFDMATLVAEIIGGA